MMFMTSLQCEILKIKGSALIWLSVLGSFLIPIVFTLRFLFIGNHINRWKADNAWVPLFLQTFRPFIGFLLPIGAIIICSLITQIEYKNNNWKQLHTTPQSYTTIFFAKYATLMLLTLLVFIMANFGAIFLGFVPTLILDGHFPKDSLPIAYFFTESIKCLIVGLPIIAFQYLLSLRFENFLVSLGVGLTIYIGTMLALKIEFSFLSPYSYVLYYFDLKIPSIHHPYYVMAIVYFLGLSLLNYLFYVNKSDKG